MCEVEGEEEAEGRGGGAGEGGAVCHEAGLLLHLLHGTRRPPLPRLERLEQLGIVLQLKGGRGGGVGLALGEVVAENRQRGGEVQRRLVRLHPNGLEDLAA